jgi:hypothetical protein
VRIYKAEKEAGIDFQANKAFVTAQVRVGDIEKYSDGMSIAELARATDTVQTVKELLGQEQPDLALIVAIMVSTGWNLNDDIFTPEEVWKARLSPVHKPINDNHKGDKILGHIVKSRVLDKSGNEVDGETIPTEFDLEVAGVLYRAFSELAERIDEIITKAKAGEIFVSVEAWFPDFGYGLIDPDTNETQLIERTEATAFLTKHLRIYGGSGNYQGYRVGRVLKDIIFGAQGFVDTPANPESVIKVAASKAAASQVFVSAELNELLEGGVEDVDEKQLQVKLEETQMALKNKEQEISELQKAVEEFKTKDSEEQITVLTKKVDELTTSVTEASEKMEVIVAEKAELQKKFNEVTKSVDESKTELEEIRKNATAQDRLVKLSEVKKIEDEKATLAELREMTDETFEVVLKYAGETKSKEVVDGESGKKTDATKTTTDDKTAEEKVAEQAEAALNNVEVDDSADLNANKDVKDSDTEWQSMAGALCGRVEKDEGGE